MPVENETFGPHLFEIRNALMDIKDPVAVQAVEVMVMALAGHFVARGFAGEFDRVQLTRFAQGVDRPVDGCDTQ